MTSRPTSLLMSGFVTHDTRRLVLARPEGFTFEPGQGVELGIDCDPWRGEGRPFTPTCRLEDQVLEFTIKRYPERDGFTVALHDLEPGAPLMISEAFGTITYQGPGVFIAAGAGITPFLAILRKLAAEGALEGHRLLFSNKSEDDLICGQELRHYLGDNAVFTYTRRGKKLHEGRHINSTFLKANLGSLDQHFYVCGPNTFVESMNQDLISLGVHPDRLVYER
jgi:ferredoxin-NADP reductase